MTHLARTIISNGTIFTEGGRDVVVCSEMGRGSFYLRDFNETGPGDGDAEYGLDWAQVGMWVTVVLDGQTMIGTVREVEHATDGPEIVVQFRGEDEFRGDDADSSSLALIFTRDSFYEAGGKLVPYYYLDANVVDTNWCDNVNIEQRDDEQEEDGDEGGSDNYGGRLNGSRVNGATLWVIPMQVMFNVWHGMQWLLPAFAMRKRFTNDVDVAVWYIGDVAFKASDVLPRINHAPGHFLSDPDTSMTREQRWWKLMESWFSILDLNSVFELESIQSQRLCYERAVFGRLGMRVDRQLAMQRSDLLSADEARVFRASVVSHPLYAKSLLSTWGATKSSVHHGLKVAPKRVVIIQRGHQGGRFAVKMDELPKLMKLIHPDVDIVAPDFPSYTLVQQASWVAESDVVLGAHGGGLAWAVLAKPGTALIELAPGDVFQSFYFCAERWCGNALGMFGGLSRLGGQKHICLKMRRTELWASVESHQWRDLPLDLDLPKVAKYLQQALTDTIVDSDLC